MKLLVGLFILTVIFLPAEFTVAAAAAIIIFYYLLDKTIIQIFSKKSVYFLFFIVAVLQPLILDQSENTAWYLSQSFLTGLAMFSRAVVIISSINILNKNIDRSKLKLFWENKGMQDFENVLVKAEELLPKMKYELKKSIKQINNPAAGNGFLKNPSEFIAGIIVPFLQKSNTSASHKKVEEV